jgi:hypothetical protein
VTEERSHPQQETKHPEIGPLGRLGVPRRFDIIAAPGRRALQGRMGIVRIVLLILAVVAIGIVVYAQWLAFQPNPGPAATRAALNRAGYESSFASSTPQPTVPPPTAEPTPTDTPTARPTNTLVPLPTARSRGRPTATKPIASPTPLPAPRLVAPEDGITALGRMVFEWAWDGPPLQENQAFDLRIWSVQEEEKGSPRRGVVPPTKDTRVEVSLPAAPAIVDFGPGDYFWSVVVVEVRADGSPQVAGVWGESRRLVYR